MGFDDDTIIDKKVQSKAATEILDALQASSAPISSPN